MSSEKLMVTSWIISMTMALTTVLAPKTWIHKLVSPSFPLTENDRTVKDWSKIQATEDEQGK